jgi:MinD superfamily P-loop ATPase
MKQIVILSGKGGTGKTSLASVFAHQAQNKVIADADVDASNLELVLAPERQEEHTFLGGRIAVIDQDRCAQCGTCRAVCRFDAVVVDEQSRYQVDPIACEGCKACVYQCPEYSVALKEQIAGAWYRSESDYGTLFHAHLRPAQENSGRLVTLVKQEARLYALDHDLDYLLVDGPPGMGCPVISAVSGADLAVLVVEPTVAGIHDLERVLGTTDHFEVPSVVVINKADINPENVRTIQTFCEERGIPVVGLIPFDPVVTEAMVQGKPVTVYAPGQPVSRAMRAVWETLEKILREV